MHTLREWMLRFWGTLTGRRRDRDLEEELRLHLELAAEEARRRGLSPDAAARATAIASGGHVHAMEALRDQRGVPWLDDLTRDVRHGLRTLRRSPVFTAVALLTLALGIGANTAIFTIVNGVILRPLAYPAPEQLITLTTNTQELSQPEYLRLREGSPFLVDVGAYLADDVNLTEGDRARRVRSATVDGHLLGALGVEAAQGRLFARGETDVSGPWFPGNPENPQPPPIAILSHHVDPGFDRSRLVTFSVTSISRARGQMYLRLLDALRALPGVQAATGMSGLPPNRPADGEDMQIDNYVDPGGDRFPGVDYFQNVMSDYFETMGIPIVAGRGFHPTDAASSGMVAVVNETLANKFWKGENPIGQQLRPPWGDWVPMFTVVGVAKDVKQGGIDRETGTEFYFFVEQMANAPDPLGRAPVTLNVVLRTTLPASALSRAVDRAVREADPTVAVAGLREMNSVFAESISRPRLLAQLIGAFAGLALSLAAVGTYGLLSYMVVERRREIGIRMALGAPRSRVLAQIMKQGLQLAAIGLVAGLAGALGLNRLIASMLFGVQPTDPATIAAVIATIAIVAAFACWLPAFRASRLDPNVVLRTD